MLVVSVVATLFAVVFIAFDGAGLAVFAMAIAIGTAFGTGYLFRAWVRARTTGPLPVAFRVVEDLRAQQGEPDDQPDAASDAPTTATAPDDADRSGPPILTQVIGALSGVVVIALGVTFFAAGSPLLLALTVTFGVATLTLSLLALPTRHRAPRAGPLAAR